MGEWFEQNESSTLITPLSCGGNNINNIGNVQFFNRKGRIGELFYFKLN